MLGLRWEKSEMRTFIITFNCYLSDFSLWNIYLMIIFVIPSLYLCSFLCCLLPPSLPITSLFFFLSHVSHVLFYRFELPLVVKLIYGRVPRTPCAFTQVLLLTDCGSSQTLIASTLLYFHNVNFELPLGRCTVPTRDRKIGCEHVIYSV